MLPKKIRVKGQVYVLADKKADASETIKLIQSMSNLVDKVIGDLIDVISLAKSVSKSKGWKTIYSGRERNAHDDWIQIKEEIVSLQKGLKEDIHDIMEAGNNLNK
jgi:hypothetical protein